MKRILFSCAIAACVLGSVSFSLANNPKPAPKSIKEVMKLAHKDGLHKKVLSGGASDAEKKQLLDLYIDMLEGTPAKGDKAEWPMVAGAAVVSAAKVVLGREGAIEELTKTSDCKGCHSKFK